MKRYILFSPHGEFYFYRRRDAIKAQKVHGGVVTRQKLYHDQILEVEL